MALIKSYISYLYPMQNIIHKHFTKAVELLELYTGQESLQFYLKKYFAGNRKHGSKDRKIIAHFCYTFFRIGKNLSDKSIEEKLKAALFLCEDSVEDIKEIFENNWRENHSPDINVRIRFIQKIYIGFSLKNIFPYEKEFSENIDITAFQQSFLIQPKVFLRIRNGKEDIVLRKLNKADIPFEAVAGNALAIPQSTNINSVLQLNSEVVVQDLSSQKTGTFLQSIHSEDLSKSSFRLWDCCAASGGKSILAKDIFGNIDLTVSDIRPQILQNLKTRFREAGIQSYKSFTADLSKPVFLKEKFNIIICDAPCSGSGTWARTPEMLMSFDNAAIEKYRALQQKIVSNIVPHLAPHGYFLYITCSVFKKENEQMAEYITENFSLKCIKSGLIKGYAQQADSMFAALFISGK